MTTEIIKTKGGFEGRVIARGAKKIVVQFDDGAYLYDTTAKGYGYLPGKCLMQLVRQDISDAEFAALAALLVR